MDQHETTTPTERKPLGRRTVLKGAAWSVPAVVAVGVTPAFAASDIPPVSEQLSVTNNRGTFTYVWRFRNDNATAMTVSGVTATSPATLQPPISVTVSPGATGTFTFTATDAGNTPPGFQFTVPNVRIAGSTTYTVPGTGKVNNGRTEEWGEGPVFADPTP